MITVRNYSFEHWALGGTFFLNCEGHMFVDTEILIRSFWQNPPILVFCGCCNKYPQTWWLKTIQLFLTVLQYKVWNQYHREEINMSARPGSLEALQKTPSLPPSNSWCLLEFLGLWLHQSNHQGKIFKFIPAPSLRRVLLCVCKVSLGLFLIKICMI